MLFQTLEFGVFFAVVYGLYLYLPHRLQNRMLLVASYVFYGACEWRCPGLASSAALAECLVELKGALVDGAPGKPRLGRNGISGISDAGIREHVQ